MKSVIITVASGGPGFKAPLMESSRMQRDNRWNLVSPCQAYAECFSHCAYHDLFIYTHDDVTIHDDDWLDRIVEEFDEPSVGVVGLGGATGLGNIDLYRKPYHISNMARHGYRSNQTDAEVHGLRTTDHCTVAVLDAFFMAVRRDVLVRAGNWPHPHLTHHCLDLWLACEAARQGVTTRVVPISCTHHGGGTSTKPSYGTAKWLQGGSLESDHQLPHRWLWDNYRDVLPLTI